jgi:ferredoxin
MRTHDDHLEPFKCVACGGCVEACPEGALRIEQVPDAEPSEKVR